jgi:hypothetical protein
MNSIRMKIIRIIGLMTVLFITAIALPLRAQISIPSDGSDGALNITSNTVIDLSKAVTGVWSNDNSANAGKGIYDASKWAVVFKYSSVNIASNTTVTFSNHPSRAPVVWLVNGAVIMNGELSLDGGAASTDLAVLAEPGPGGFRGGAAGNGVLSSGPGFGPGGGGLYSYGIYDGSYGSPQIVPLIGGSGASYGGSAGGGAILIACSGAITINGTCHALAFNTGYNSSGSAGGIRLLADQILGSGSLRADFAAQGRIRLEANSVSVTLGVNPAPSLGLPSPVVIWPASNSPTVRIVSIGEQPAPADPRAQLGASQDVRLFTNSAPIILETANFPTNGTVTVYIKPRNGSQTTATAAYVGGTSNLATWQYQATIPLRDSVIQVRCVSP